MQPFRIMGIVNLTDNSFVCSSRMKNAALDEILNRVQFLVENGADIIDVGACSSAPGNSPVDEEEEWRRLGRVLPHLFSSFPDVDFSIDTFRSGIVRNILAYGRNFTVNDIFSGSADAEMIPLVVSSGLKYIAMDSSDNPFAFFEEFASKAEHLGLENWILDPGFGFGKSVERNWEILDSLDKFAAFGKTVLAALSRKRMIYLPNGLTADTCSEISVEVEKYAVSKGAGIIRTHDVADLAAYRSSLQG